MAGICHCWKTYTSRWKTSRSLVIAFLAQLILYLKLKLLCVYVCIVRTREEIYQLAPELAYL